MVLSHARMDLVHAGAGKLNLHVSIAEMTDQGALGSGRYSGAL